MLNRHLLVSLGAAAVGLATLAIAQPVGGDFTVPRNTVDAGGGISAGGAFSVSGTIGQPDASAQPMSGGPFELTGGFWIGGNGGILFEDGFENQ